MEPYERPEFSHATSFLFVLNLAVFAATFLISSPTHVLSTYSFYPPAFLSGDFFSIITSGFVHVDIPHLFWNMIFLWIFGRVVEREYNGWWVLGIYFTGLVLGNLFTMLLFPEISVTGASGAVFGLIGAAILLRPMKPFLGYEFMPLALIGVVYMIPSFLNMFNLENQIADISHVGGALGGALIAFARDKERAEQGLWIVIAFVALVLGIGLM
ncbi:MAG: rhomboid family intramembrane serine protease [Candidatus Nanohaloarchaea archaeon]|nr:rhomboid family intramembrane serine protease [Candidatus Nanohaloarchaea archaeon]